MSTPTKTTLDEKQRQALRFTVGASARFARLCERGQALANLIEARVSPVRANPTELSVNQMLLLLQDEFFARFEAAPKDHRTLGSPQHSCLLTVYLGYLQELIDLRSWQVSPPLVREPPPPPAPPQIAGVPYGIRK